jgi:5-(aminomethyl)-3-furanmethanol phosphate kinase
MIETVVKLGGAALGVSGIEIPSDGRTLIVPGGGPFADTVRAVDARFGLGDDAAHWAAILAMDQYAYVLAALVRSARVVHTPEAVGLPMHGLPILAPFRWLRETDPLPHSWDVTSDSIAAWVAHAVGAKRLLLVKPVDQGPDLVDRYFDCVKGDLDVRVLGVGALASPPAWHNLSKL